MRTVPGVNITQVSARDINVTIARRHRHAVDRHARAARRPQPLPGLLRVRDVGLPAGEPERDQAGRSASAGRRPRVWGANALNGVVNVITKSPREMQGTSADPRRRRLRSRSRTTGDSTGAGTLFYISGTHAQAVNDRVAFKISAGGYTQDPLRASDRTDSRATAPRSAPPARKDYPGYANQGTTQPKFDARVDYDYADGRSWSFSGGVAGTDGIMHTGIGPFDINNGSVMGYGKVNLRGRASRAGVLHQHPQRRRRQPAARRDTAGKPDRLRLRDQDVRLRGVERAGFKNKHVVTYGGNLRFNTFDLSLAPPAENRTEGGGYLQDEIFLSQHVPPRRRRARRIASTISTTSSSRRA